MADLSTRDREGPGSTDVPGRRSPVSAAGRATGRALRAAVKPFAARGPLRLLYVAALVDAIGLGTYISFSAVYFSQGVGLSDAQVGLVLTWAGVASMVGVMPVGMLADRIGARAALMSLYLWRGVAFIALATAHDLLTASVAAAAAGILSRAMSPVTQALALDLTTDGAQRIEALAVMRALRNGGFAIGAFPSAIAIATSAYSSVLYGSTVLFVVAAALSSRIPSAARAIRKRVSRARALRDRRFLLLTAVNGAIGVQGILLAIGLPLWLVERTAAPRWMASLIAVMNTLLILGFQVRASRGAERTSFARRLLAAAAIVSAGACLLPPLAQHVGGPAAAGVICADVLVFTLGELWLASGGWGLAVAYSTDEARASYFAVFNLGTAAMTIVGPGIAGALLAVGTAGWLAAAGFFVVAAVAARALPLVADQPEATA